MLSEYSYSLYRVMEAVSIQPVSDGLNDLDNNVHDRVLKEMECAV
jgi:hypothetical protein